MFWDYSQWSLGEAFERMLLQEEQREGWATLRVLSEGIPDAVLARSLPVSALCLRHEINSASCTFKNIDQTPAIF